MNYYIITGTSRGLGEALALRLLSKDHYLFCISRSKNETLLSIAKNKEVNLEYIPYDLANVDDLENLVDTIFKKINLKQAHTICLINNAGVVNPIKTIGNCNNDEIITNVKINAIAPMLLTNEFIKRTKNLECERIVFNISSGAGRKPYYGWGSYSSSKAAIDMFTKCVGVEQEDKKNPVKIFSFAPGIIDTDMQQEIRQSNKEDFIQIERFIKFKEEGMLKDPDFVAKKVIELIENKDLKSGTLMDVKEFLE